MSVKLTLNLVTHYTPDGKLHLGDEMFKSILDQTDINFKLNVIVNNFNYSKGYESKLHLLKYHTDCKILPIKSVENLSVARNLGIDNVTTDYFTQLDSDDYLDLDYVKKINLAIKKSKGKLIKFGVIEHFNDKDRYFPYQDQLFYSYDYDYMFNSSYVFPKSVPFRYPDDVKLKLEDQLAYIKYMIKNNVKEVYFIPEYLYHYIKREDSFGLQDYDHVSDRAIYMYLRELCPTINVNYLYV